MFSNECVLCVLLKILAECLSRASGDHFGLVWYDIYYVTIVPGTR